MRVCVLVPQSSGHYLRYADFLRLNGVDVDIVEVSDRGVGGLSRFCINAWVLRKLIRRGGYDAVIGFAGERQIITALLIRVLLGVRVALLFYYGFSARRGLPYKGIASIALLMLSMAGVRLLYLEGSSKFLPSYVLNKVSILYDFPMDVGGALTEPSHQKAQKFLLAGHITERKNYEAIVKACNQLCSEAGSHNIKLVIIGEQTESARNFLSTFQASDRLELVIQDERVSDECMFKALEQCDAVFTVYSDHIGSSGMFINAIFHGKRVIFHPRGVLSVFSEELGVSSGMCDITLPSLKRAILECLVAETPQYSPDAQEVFFRNRSAGGFAEKIIDVSMRR